MDILVKLFIELPDVVFVLFVIIFFMTTYHISTIYIRKNRKDLSRILYGNKNKLKKIDGYDMHFLIIAMGCVYMNHHLKYKKKGTYVIPNLPWFPELTDDKCIKLMKNHKKLLKTSFYSFFIGFIGFFGSVSLIWIAERV